MLKQFDLASSLTINCRLVWFLSLIFVFPLFAPIVSAQEIGHEVRGRVTTEAGAPANPPVRIQLQGTGGSLLSQTFTDSSGSYAFVGVRNGSYQLVVESDGVSYERTAVEVELFFSSGNRIPQMVTRNITLIPKKGATNLSPEKGDREIDASIPKDAKKEFDKGMKSSKSGKSDEAIDHFHEAIKIHPKYFAAQLALGEEFSKMRNYDAARAAFLQAADNRPKSPQAQLGLGIVLVKSGAHNEAIAHIREAMELGEKSATAHLFLGIALMEMETFDEAEKMFLKAIDIGGTTQPGLRLYLANFYNRRGDRKKTIEQLEAYIRDAPTASNVAEIEQMIKSLREQK